MNTGSMTGAVFVLFLPVVHMKNSVKSVPVFFRMFTNIFTIGVKIVYNIIDLI